MITNFTIGDLMIDCANPEKMRDFYANITGYKKMTSYNCPAINTDNGLIILFAEIDIPYVPPVWPEEPNTQQKQMHLDFTVDDVPLVMEQVIRFGGAKAAMQYGGDGQSFVTMLDPEGKPFCLCKRYGNTEFDLYYRNKGYGAIPDISINIDCRRYTELRAFYAELTDWDQGFHETALVADNRMVVHFMEADFEYISPVWPEEPGKQQKQLHFNFQVDDLAFAISEVIRLGGKKANAQYGGEHFVTMQDTDGHPFCLCKKG